jgi:hypothetical protein
MKNTKEKKVCEIGVKEKSPSFPRKREGLYNSEAGHPS